MPGPLRMCTNHVGSAPTGVPGTTSRHRLCPRSAHLGSLLRCPREDSVVCELHVLGTTDQRRNGNTNQQTAPQVAVSTGQALRRAPAPARHRKWSRSQPLTAAHSSVFSYRRTVLKRSLESRCRQGRVPLRPWTDHPLPLPASGACRQAVAVLGPLREQPRASSPILVRTPVIWD